MPTFDWQNGFPGNAMLYGPDGTAVQWNVLGETQINEEASGEEDYPVFVRPGNLADAEFTVSCSKKTSRKAIKLFRKESNILRRRVRYMRRFAERRRRAMLKGEKYLRVSRKYAILFNPLVLKEGYSNGQC